MITRILLISMLLWVALPSVAQDDELLEPEKAFAFSAAVVDAQTIEATWKIADGYYLYGSKFGFEVLGKGVETGKFELPPGKRKQDEFFGEVEIYTKSVTARVPLKRTAGDTQSVTLRASSQGCNEPIGVCYPPLTQEAQLTLAAVTTAPAATAPATIDSLKSLSGLLDQNAAGDEFLAPDDAFKLLLEAVDGNTLRAHFQIADDYYLYRDKTSFRSGSDHAVVAPYTLPKGKEKIDEFFGKTEVYYGTVSFDLPVDRASGAAAPMQVIASYQGCAEKGICYPPVNKTLEVSLPAGIAGASQDIDTAKRVSAREYLLAILGALGVGFLLTFTPCVLPMIPILSSIIVGQGGASPTHMRGGMLSTVYVLGTAVTYTAAGVLAGFSGNQLQAYFQNVWAIGIFSAILVLLALSMFGFYEIQMPSAVQSRLQSRSQSLQGGKFIGVFIMGIVSALIVGACASPLLLSVLGLAIASKDPVLGGWLMFAMAMGMGVVLIAVGFGANFLLPRAGMWMDKVKYVFGVLLLGVAIYLLSLVLPEAGLFLWAALLIITSVYLGALQGLPEGVSGWRYLWKGVGVFMLIWGVLALLGGMAGERDILRPLPLNRISAVSGSSGGATVPVNVLFQSVKTVTQLDAALTQAQSSGKPVVIDYYADWCSYCVKMESSTFVDAQVQTILQNDFVALKIDVTDPNDADANALKKRYGVFAPPAYLFVSPDGRLLEQHNFYGYQSAEEFRTTLNNVRAEA